MWDHFYNGYGSALSLRGQKYWWMSETRWSSILFRNKKIPVNLTCSWINRSSIININLASDKTCIRFLWNAMLTYMVFDWLCLLILEKFSNTYILLFWMFLIFSSEEYISFLIGNSKQSNFLLQGEEALRGYLIQNTNIFWVKTIFTLSAIILITILLS